MRTIDTRGCYAPAMRSVVVTGASTGIGRAAVARAVREGAHVYPTVRKAEDAAGLSAEFGDRVTPLVMDVTDERAISAAAARVSDWLKGGTLFGLVNNAGVAVPGPLPHLTTDELRAQFETNLFGVHAVTRAFLPLLGADRARTGDPGRIVMISSIAGRNAHPFVGAYVASKHALEGYAQSLRRELMLHGIKVIVIAPGSVATPIWDKAESAGLERFSATPFGPASNAVTNYMLARGRAGLPAETIADAVWTALSTANPRQRVTVMRGKFLGYTLPRLLPDAVMDRLIAKKLGLTRT
jgi:NAD(P)-dependent dehydrogenase (short-subunit alcohol dehydrogenase family)